MSDPKVVARGDGRVLQVMEDRQLVKLSAKDTGGAFTLIEQSIAPGAAIPMHYHEREDETFIVTEGEILFEAGDASRVAKPGDVVFAPRRVPHRWHERRPRRREGAPHGHPGRHRRHVRRAGAAPAPPRLRDHRRDRGEVRGGVRVREAIEFVPASS
jgi:quercetin dioxygenase-like cupin family protein